jgi:hypothetical protein
MFHKFINNKIINNINSDFKEIVLFFFKKQNKYNQYMQQNFGTSKKQICRLIEFGLSELPDFHMEDKKNYDLANYFSILSEIKKLPDDLHSFLVDVMLYCEEGFDVPTGFQSIQSIKKEFANLKCKV